MKPKRRKPIFNERGIKVTSASVFAASLDSRRGPLLKRITAASDRELDQIERAFAWADGQDVGLFAAVDSE